MTCRKPIFRLKEERYQFVKFLTLQTLFIALLGIGFFNRID